MASYWSLFRVLFTLLCVALSANVAPTADARRVAGEFGGHIGRQLAEGDASAGAASDTTSVTVERLGGSVKYYNAYNCRYYGTNCQSSGFAWWGIFLICLGSFFFFTVLCLLMCCRRIAMRRAIKRQQQENPQMAAQMPYQGPYPPYGGAPPQQYGQQEAGGAVYPSPGQDQPALGVPHEHGKAPNPYPPTT